MKILKTFAPVITIILIIVLWYILALIVNIRLILPTPWETLQKMGEIFTTKTFYAGLFGTLKRALLSFFAALILSLVFALLANGFEFFEKLFYPLVMLVRATPTMSVIFLCIIWFSSKISPMIVAFTVIFPTLYNTIYGGLKSVDRGIIEMSEVFCVPKKVKITRYYLPYLMDKVFYDITSTISLNVKLIIAAEALAQTNLSLGVSMQIAKVNLETATLFAYTVAAIILSFMLELILKGIRLFFRRVRDAKTC